MKIVLIHGQNHKGNSYHLGRMAAEQFENSNILAEFFLPRDLNNYCLGCTQCLEAEEKCPYWMKKKDILEKIEEADLLILTTPVYCLGCSAAMKSFLDLTFSYWLPHKPKPSMFSKKALVVTTAAGTGMNKAINQVRTALQYWGISQVEGFGVALRAPGWEQVPEKRRRKLQRLLSRKIKKLEKSPVRTSIKVKMLFEVMRRMINGYPDDSMEKAYWNKEGWLDGKRPWNG